MFELCRQLGVPCPKATVPESLSQALDFANSSGFPLVAKLTSPWTSGGLRSTSIVTDQQSLREIYADCSRAGAGLMLQEFIPGSSGHDWFFHGYCDITSTCRPAFTGVKERSYPAHAALTSLGRSAQNAPPRSDSPAAGCPFLSRDRRYRDPLDARDDEYKLLTSIRGSGPSSGSSATQLLHSTLPSRSI